VSVSQTARQTQFCVGLSTESRIFMTKQIKDLTLEAQMKETILKNKNMLHFKEEPG
jgi:hypothetical protein